MSLHLSKARRVWLRIAILAGLLSVLLNGAALAYQPAAPTASRPHAMPPHPDLRQRIRAGEIVLPRQHDQIDQNVAEGLVEQAVLAGQLKALAVLVDFSDQVSSVQATYFDSLIFAAPVAGRGSVRDYFADVSFGQVDVVTLNMPSSLGWKRAPQNKPYYVDNAYCTDGGYPNDCRKLAEDVVDAINAVVDFKQYDNNGDGTMEPIMLIHAGAGAEASGLTTDIWSHSWYLYNYRNYDGVTINRYVIMPEYGGSSASRYDIQIGVFCHEMGHGFWNLPDLYDTDGSSEGIGNWSLMAGGSWNGVSMRGESPAWPDAWSRIKMGYATATELTANAMNQAIPKVTTANTGTIFKLKNSVLSSSEYFLVENRQRTTDSYDQYLPGPGLAIWHIDDAKSGNTQECRSDPHYLCGSTHYKVALEQSDGARDLEYDRDRGDAADLFPGSLNNTNWTGATHPESSSYTTSAATNIGVTNISAAADTMTANLLIAPAAATPSVSINDVSVNEGNSGATAANFTVSLSAAASSAVSVNWATADGNATAGSDYAAGSGTVTFAAGETAKTVSVQVYGDTSVESSETFYVNLSGPSGATIADGQGVGTIVNDDSSSSPTVHVGDLDGSKKGGMGGRWWSATVTITAHDQNHAVVSGARVTGSWAGSGSVSCTTGTNGTCSITRNNIAASTTSIAFNVSGVTKSGLTYTATSNHDPDGDSNGTTITITKP